MLKLRRDYPRIPPGGWRFEDASGVIIKGTSSDNLIDNIAAFRLQNSLAEGWPEREVTWFMAEKHPDFVERTEATIEELAKTIEDRLTDWTNELWRDPPRKLLELKLVSKRIDTCLECPHRSAWSVSKEDKNPEIVRKLVILSRGNYVRHIGYCAAHRAHAGLLVLLPDPKVKTIPSCCFIGKPDSLTEETL